MTSLADAERARFAGLARNGAMITRPAARWPFMTSPQRATATEPQTADSARPPGSLTNGWLVAGASLLLTALAVAMGIVSWHAQYTFIFAIKHQRLASALEALGLDCGAVVFSLLGIALARLGRRAVIERALVCICAGGSCMMNAAGANLGSPRQVAAFVMPPVLFAITSDRLVSVIRRSALGPKADTESQRSAWRTGGLAFLYLLRLLAAPPSTIRGARLGLLNATPLPELPVPSPEPRATTRPKPPRRPSRSRSRRRSGPTKTQQFLDLVAERHGPLAEFPFADVYRVAADLAPEVSLHPGSARSALRAAVVAAQQGSAR